MSQPSCAPLRTSSRTRRCSVDRRSDGERSLTNEIRTDRRRTVGQNESNGRVKSHSAAVSITPVRQLSRKLQVARARSPAIWSRQDEHARGVALDVHIAIELTERKELIV